MDGSGLKKICFIYRYYHDYLHIPNYLYQYNIIYSTTQRKSTAEQNRLCF